MQTALRIAFVCMAVTTAGVAQVLWLRSPASRRFGQPVDFGCTAATVAERLADVLEGRIGRRFLHRDPDGGFDGVRLSGIRDGDAWDRMGARNGDLLHAVGRWGP